MSFRKSKNLFFAFFASFAVSSTLVGCGSLFHTTPAKPQLYCIEGRVLDGLTRQGIGKARILLREIIPMQLQTQALAAAGSPDARGSGAVQLSSYAVTAEDGSYTVELSEGFQIVRSATRIRLEASLPGYSAAGIDLPAPTAPEPVYKAPDLFLAHGTLAPPSTLPRGVTVPGLPSAPGGPRPRTPNPIQWK